jgi:hypothetical protein
MFPVKKRVLWGVWHATIVALAMLTLWAPVGTLFAQPTDGESVSLAEYREMVADARQILADTGDLESAQEILAAVTLVKLPSGNEVPIIPLLDGAPDVESALGRLDVMLAELDAAGNDRTIERLNQLQQVLADLDLQRLTLWDRFLLWLQQLIDSLRGRNRISGPSVRTVSTFTAWFIAASGAVLLLLVLSYWLQRLLGGFVTEAALRQRLQQGLDEPLTARSAQRRAADLAKKGSYREAVRQLYLAALLHLDEANVLQYTQDLTNHEMLEQLTSANPVRRQLEPVVDTFDRVWYGEREPDSQTFIRYQQDVQTLMKVVGDAANGKPTAGKDASS